MKGPSLSRALLVASLVVAVAFAGGCRSARIDEKTAEQATTVPPVDVSGALPAPPVVGSLDYRVGPLDVLDVQVFGVEALTRTARVTQAGEISLAVDRAREGAGTDRRPSWRTRSSTACRRTTWRIPRSPYSSPNT